MGSITDLNKNKKQRQSIKSATLTPPMMKSEVKTTGPEFSTGRGDQSWTNFETFLRLLRDQIQTEKQSKNS